MRRVFAVLLTAGLGLALTFASSSLAGNGTKDVGPNYNHGKAKQYDPAENEPGLKFAAPKGPAKIGDQKVWPALDDAKGRVYLKYFTLRGAGDHIEVWVANNLKFPKADDCRNAYMVVTDEQVNALVHEFATNIYPKESEAFSVPDKRQGEGGKYLARAVFGQQVPSSYYVGDGQDIVVLVDNVRDDNYYDPTTPAGQTYIAGFFYTYFDDLVDRNVMTIDGYDWVHRTGATPPDDRGNTGCSLVSGAPRPHLYEGTFAHEYQHLLESYSDPDEYSWVNEGLSDWAQTLVGYADPTLPQPGGDSHIQCFEGWSDPSFGGPENSLTAWGDQGGPEILCDYGAAYSFMQMLATRYGDAFMSALHRDPGNGLAGLNDVLAQFATGKTAEQVVHEWAALMALDNQAGTSLTGGSVADYTSSGLWSTINWANPEAYDDPGAPPNGSDYVPLGSASSISSIDFQGSATLPPHGVEWTVDANPPGRAGNAALSSGAANDRDVAIGRSVTFGASPALTFESFWNEEDGWDFGFVQVSTDGGLTYKSLACTDTTTTTDPGALPTAKGNVPGFTGYSGGWKAESCDASAYAGQTVILSFRAFNDPGTLGGAGAPAGTPAGFWVDDVAVDGAIVSDGSDLGAWESPTQIHPIPVHGFTVQLVAYDGAGNAWLYQLPLDSSFHGSLTGGQVAAALGTTATTVGVIVTYDDPTELIGDQAPYTLKVNGVVQPGG